MVYIVNRYELQEVLGEGGMGKVYRAYDRLNQVTVALKRVHHKMEYESHIAHTERVAMLQEFRTLASLRHPQIITVLDYGIEDNGQPFFTMTLIENALSIIDYGSRSSNKQKVKLIIQALQALIYLHRLKIIHRDLKPANIVVMPSGEVKVLDFGLAAQGLQSGGASGTLAYLAPEVLKGAPASELSDLYSLGVVAYELLIGHYPFTHPIEILKDILNTMPDVSMLENEKLGVVLSRWLMKDPSSRYQSAQSIIDDLCHVLDLSPPQESRAIRESFLQAAQFLGRDEELNILMQELESVVEGGVSFYLIGGESGSGKSRLMDELRINAQVSGALVLSGQSIQGGVPFQLWRNILRRLLLIINLTDTQLSILKNIIPNIDDILGREISDTLLNVPDEQKLLIDAIVDILHDLQQPIVLILEDLQWAETSLEPIKLLLNQRDELSHIMIIGSYRNDESPDLSSNLPTCSIMTLNRLSRCEIKKLSQSMLGESATSEQLLDLLETQTEGNAFFLVETVRALAEDAGGLQHIGNASLPEQVFTGGMQQIIKHRLSKVDSNYQKVQTFAAIIGREIDRNLLTHQFSHDVVDGWLMDATHIAVLDVYDNVWRFAHDKFREALLMELTDSEREQGHEQVARVIKTVYPDHPDYYQTLLLHWRMAGNQTQEALYLHLIVNRLIHLDGNFIDAQRLVYDFLERCDHQAEYINRIFALMAEIGRRSQNFEVALEFSQKISDNNPTPDEQAIVYENRAAVAFYQGDLEKAEAIWSASLELRTQLTDTTYIPGMLNNLGFLALNRQDYQTAKVYLEESLILSRSRQPIDFPTFTNTLNNLGFLSIYLGNIDQAEQIFYEALEIIHTNSLIPLLLTTITGLAHLQLLFGNVEKAAKWIGLVENHPSLRPETRSGKVQPVINLLSDKLSLIELETQFMLGAELDMMAEAKAMLDLIHKLQ